MKMTFELVLLVVMFIHHFRTEVVSYVLFGSWHTYNSAMWGVTSFTAMSQMISFLPLNQLHNDAI